MAELIQHDGWIVPPTFTEHSDGCSVPWLLRPLLGLVYRLMADREERYVKACYWHDWARRHLVHYGVMTVQEADWGMRNYLRELGMPRWLAQAYWLGVKVLRPWFRATRPIPPDHKEWRFYLTNARERA